MAVSSKSNTPDLATLVALFYSDPQALGPLTEMAADALPIVYRRQLVHEEHMTVAVEAHHEDLVDVEVVDTLVTDTHYARKILLRRRQDRKVVQFGIMRMHLGCLDDEVCQEIVSQERPLGRILVRHNVLRIIHLASLWKVQPSEELCQLFGISESQETYGRTAGIDLDGHPAVELLEIVAPE